MKLNKTPILLLAFLAIFLSACNLYDVKESEPYVTYRTTVGGNGYDLVTDVIEADDAYILAGALGPQCDIVDAFMAKVGKEDGATIILRTFGDSNQGREENFFSIAWIQDRLRAVGFSLTRLPPSSATSTRCDRPPNDNIDGRVFLASLDENFDQPTSTYLELDSLTWDSGFDIQESPDKKILIAGARHGSIALMQIEADTVFKAIISDNFYGDAYNLLFHSNGRVFLVGGFIAPPNFNLTNIYWAEVELTNGRFLNERSFTFENRGGWQQSLVGGIVETPDGNLLLTGTLSNATNDDVVFILKTDLQGNELMYKNISFGSNDGANDMIRVDDGYVLCGRSNLVDVKTKTDAMIAKIDEAGNVLWKEFHDLNENDEWAETLIRTSDGGFLIAGRTINQEVGIQTILLVKTDAEGKVE